MRSQLPEDSARRCFPRPMPRPARSYIVVPPIQLPSQLLASAALTSGLTDNAATALGRVLPSLLCGEESAVVVFSNEARRLDPALHGRATDTLQQISAEEEYHEQLLTFLQRQLPSPDDLPRRRNLARRYFLTLMSRDIGEHFARIAALDSAVCVILSELIRAGSPVAASSPVAALLRRIIMDEARHVSFSRRHAEMLGVSAPARAASRTLVREGLVALLRNCGDSFEAISADPDRLFRRLTADAGDAGA